MTPPARIAGGVDGVDRGQRVAAGREVPVDAGHVDRARQQDEPGAGLAQRGDGVRGPLGVERVGGAEHRDRACRPPANAATTSSAVGRRAGLDRLDAAGGQQVAGEPGARGVGGERAERGQERARAGAGRGQHGVGAVAAAPRTAPPAGRPAARRRSGRRQRLALDGLLGQVGELADPGDRRCAGWPTSASRCARTAPTRSATRPESSAATAPPAASISWKNAHPARARPSVSDSTSQEPPAGSITRARCDSSTSSAWVLRAIRRENGGGGADRGVERRHGDRVRPRRRRRRSRPACRAAGSRRGRAG